MQCAVVTWWQSRDDAALIHSPNLPIIRILKKYTIRSIVCEASCHPVTQSFGHLKSVLNQTFQNVVLLPNNKNVGATLKLLNINGETM